MLHTCMCTVEPCIALWTPIKCGHASIIMQTFCLVRNSISIDLRTMESEPLKVTPHYIMYYIIICKLDSNWLGPSSITTHGI